MRFFSETLIDLIDFAQEVITRPTRVYGFDDNKGFKTLAAEVRHADALPAEGKRTTRAAIAMINALEEFLSCDREATSPILGIVGNMLPWLRGAASTAFSSEREVRASEQDNIYARPSPPSQSVELS